MSSRRAAGWMLAVAASILVGFVAGLLSKRGTFNHLNRLFVREGMTRAEVESWLGPGSDRDSAEPMSFVGDVWRKHGVAGTQFVTWRSGGVRLGGEYLVGAFSNDRLVGIYHFVPTP